MSTQTIPESIDNSADIIDVRDVIERVEYLEAEIPSSEESDGFDQSERVELAELTELLDELRGNGGDHEWKDAWYPITLVRESYFEDFARQEAEDLGLISSDTRWPATCINWEQAAEELKIDYSTVEFGGVPYLYR